MDTIAIESMPKANGVIRLAPAVQYTLKQLTVSSNERLTIESEDPRRPASILVTERPDDYGAIKTLTSSTLSIHDVSVRFENPKNYLLDVGMSSIEVTNVATGNGGFARIYGCLKFIAHNVVGGGSGNYWIFGGGPAHETAVTYTMGTNGPIELYNCSALRSQWQSMLRFHCCGIVKIYGGRYDNTGGPKAWLRFHDYGRLDMRGVTGIGDYDLGPLGEADGGINMPPGPKRDYYDRLRCLSASIKDCELHSGYGALYAGLLNFDMEHCKVWASKSGAVFKNTGRYMSRLPAVGIIRDTQFVYPNGRLFGTQEVAGGIAVASNVTFNGKPVRTP
jgi:hypothetical protein